VNPKELERALHALEPFAEELLAMVYPDGWYPERDSAWS
jgi:hypothetical protein